MRDPNADENNLTPADFWCDFCRRAWGDDLAMIEGHKGSLACARCLTVAYRVLVIDEHEGDTYEGDHPEGAACTMCLEHRKQAMWQSPAEPDAWICLRCVKLSARAMEKDPDSGWSRPE